MFEKNTKSPLVSIIVPVYNGSNYLAQALDSALAQTYPNIEIIVVNDGSDDDDATEKIALAYQSEHKEIRYFLKSNGGVSSALNYGIEKMNGDYFSWLSHDDLYHPDKISKEMSYIESENDIVICPSLLINAEGNTIPLHIDKVSGKFNGRQLLSQMINGRSFNGLGFLIPKSVFLRYGVFDESMRYLQDKDLWMRLMLTDLNFIYFSTPLVTTRIHNEQVTITHSELRETDKVVLAKKHIPLLSALPKSVQKEYIHLYYRFFITNDIPTGLNLLKDLLKDNGYSIARCELQAFPFRLLSIYQKMRRCIIKKALKILKIRK